MEFQIDDAVNLLSRTPDTLNHLIRELPESWVMANEGPETWSAFDIVGHLIEGEETDWIPRVRIIFEHGESKTFEPFQRHAQLEKSKAKSMSQLLDEFESLRNRNLTALLAWNIRSDQLLLRGTHPELGSVTLGQLLATWVTHDLSHIAQTGRVLCRQYSDAVGPWKAYLPILVNSH